eukprot:TRINITY_DN4840_c0_g1_i1.p1 TRINITY_DN4840_c0_g1~~TRINITY_DN4840_c0_g1_i1.p1  ORF type:complete len:146 (+),score=26.87 TRINITY_DN4840_c0_g1_i1:49-486(+)
MFRYSISRLAKTIKVKGVLKHVGEENGAAVVMIDGKKYNVTGELKHDIQQHVNDTVEAHLTADKKNINYLHKFDAKVAATKNSHLVNLEIAEAVLKRPECRYIDIDTLYPTLVQARTFVKEGGHTIDKAAELAMKDFAKDEAPAS